jgi:hypothetical protein
MPAAKRIKTIEPLALISLDEIRGGLDDSCVRTTTLSLLSNGAGLGANGRGGIVRLDPFQAHGLAVTLCKRAGQ